MATCPLAAEYAWTDKSQYNDAERIYYESLSGATKNLRKGVSEIILTPDLCKSVANETTPEPTSTTSKSKKSKKNKKDSLSSDVDPKLVEVSATSTIEKPTEQIEQVVGDKKKNKKSKKVKPVEEINAPTDVPIVAPIVVEAKEKKSKNQKQKEKKAAARLMSANTLLEPIQPVVEAAPVAQENTRKKGKADKKMSTEDKVIGSSSCPLVTEIAKAREHIKNSLERMDGKVQNASPGTDLLDRISFLEKDNNMLRGVVEGLQKMVLTMESRLNQMDKSGNASTATSKVTAPAAAKAPAAADSDDGVDLFDSDSEDEAAAEQLKADRVKAYNDKKSKKPALIAKSSILFDVKPWDDETDMKQLEACVRAVQMEGLLWGASKLVPVGYGINKLQICSVIVDDLVSVDDIQEKIQENEDFVQSVDIAAFNKI